MVERPIIIVMKYYDQRASVWSSRNRTHGSVGKAKRYKGLRVGLIGDGVAA